jgi:radical SAM superfamily enzyme YgiQ (UPF0313 family)
MKVLLIYPDTDPLSVIPTGLINIEPLGLEYLAGELYDHDVDILDMKIEKDWKYHIEQFQPDVVGITGTVIHTTRMIEILGYVKEIFPETITVVGGTQATLVPNDFLTPEVDILVPGQNPNVFRDLIATIEEDNNLDEVNGLMIRTNTNWKITTPVVPPHNLDHLPMPRRKLTSKYRSKYCHIFWKPVAMMITSVGCPHACNFCPCPTLTGRRVLRRSPELVVRELLDINEKYIYISDDNIFFDYRHAMQIADLIKRAGQKKHYYVLSRVDDIVKHPDLIEKWADIGLKKVFLGLESPNDDEIKSLNKKGSVSENNKAIEILHANKIDTLGAFIINPDYTREDFDRILDYMDKMKIYYFEFTILTPFPGTEFYNESKNEIISNDHRLFDLAHSLFPTCLPTDKFYREYLRLHRRASSPIRALKIKPAISPFKNMGYFRQIPKGINLFLSVNKAYRKLT